MAETVIYGLESISEMLVEIYKSLVRSKEIHNESYDCKWQ